MKKKWWKCASFFSFTSVQFHCSVMSDYLQPHELQNARLPCPSPIARACSNLCPLSRWRHPTISSSVITFSSCLQSFPASGSFFSESVLCIKWPKYWSFSFNISPFSEYSGLISFSIDLLNLLAVQGLLKSLLQHHSIYLFMYLWLQSMGSQGVRHDLGTKQTLWHSVWTH